MINKKKVYFVLLIFCVALLASACDSKIPAFSAINRKDKSLDINSAVSPLPTEIEKSKSVGTDKKFDSNVVVTEGGGAQSDTPGVNSFASPAISTPNTSTRAEITIDETASSAVNSLSMPIRSVTTQATHTESAGSTQSEIKQAEQTENTGEPKIGLPEDIQTGIATPTPPTINPHTTEPVGAGPKEPVDPNFCPGWCTPATIYCLEKGGKSKPIVIPYEDQYALCQFSDGTECEEWQYYYGKCLPGQYTKWTLDLLKNSLNY